MVFSCGNLLFEINSDSTTIYLPGKQTETGLRLVYLHKWFVWLMHMPTLTQARIPDRNLHHNHTHTRMKHMKNQTTGPSQEWKKNPSEENWMSLNSSQSHESVFWEAKFILVSYSWDMSHVEDTGPVLMRQSFRSDNFESKPESFRIVLAPSKGCPTLSDWFE